MSVFDERVEIHGVSELGIIVFGVCVSKRTPELLFTEYFGRIAFRLINGLIDSCQ
jgi:hypothetical protein